MRYALQERIASLLNRSMQRTLGDVLIEHLFNKPGMAAYPSP
jgi:hypothetical protein